MRNYFARLPLGRLYDDQDATGTAAGTGAAGGEKDAAYWQAEAKKAFAARDAVKKEAAELQAKLLPDEAVQEYRTLKDQAAKAEEDRKKKAGEFESLHKQTVEKHQAELKTWQEKHSHVTDRFKRAVVKAEFGAATEYFGGQTAKTILDVDLALAALGRYVRVDETEDETGYRVVVTRPNGETIFGADGNPAPFAEAIGELIKALPNKDVILRGSGKTGSGSAGGTLASGQSVPLRNLTPAQLRDPEVLKQLRQQAGSGGVVMGTAYER